MKADREQELEEIWTEWEQVCGPNKLYHVSVAENRDSISSKGLRVKHCVPGEARLEGGPVVFLSEYPYFRPEESDSDLWEVDTDGLTLEELEIDDGAVWASREDISADRCSLIDPAPGTVRGGWSSKPARNRAWIKAFSQLPREALVQ